MVEIKLRSEVHNLQSKSSE